MNPLNYGSLEACQKLHDAGIVVETEHCWQWHDPCSPDDAAYGAYGEWSLVNRSTNYLDPECIPALSMAEAWRELPRHIVVRDRRHHINMDRLGEETNVCYANLSGYNFRNTNPTDALIDLLIWLKGQGKEKV